MTMDMCLEMKLNYLDMELTDGEVDEMVVEADSNNDAQVHTEY